MRVLGLDPSTKATGWAVMDASEFKVFEFGCLVPDKQCEHPADWMAESVVELVGKHTISLVSVEHYGGRFLSSLIPLIELGGVIRYRLRLLGVPVVQYPPSVVKKFVTGSGSAEKAKVQRALRFEMGLVTRNPDEADAIGLAMLACARTPGLELSEERRVLAFRDVKRGA